MIHTALKFVKILWCWGVNTVKYTVEADSRVFNDVQENTGFGGLESLQCSEAVSCFLLTVDVYLMVMILLWSWFWCEEKISVTRFGRKHRTKSRISCRCNHWNILFRWILSTNAKRFCLMTNNYRKHLPSRKANSHTQLVKKFPTFHVPDGLIPCLQKPAHGRDTHFLDSHFNIILSYALCSFE